MRHVLSAVVLLSAFAPGAVFAGLKEHSVRAFEVYIRKTEARIETQVSGSGFLWADESSLRLAQVRSGRVVVGPFGQEPEISIQDGLIHDWIGSIFIPGATLAGTLAMVQNYDNHKNVYKPEVIDSRLLNRSGNDFKVRLLLLKKKVLTVVLNTDHDVRYFPLDGKRCHSRSYSSRIVEVVNYGKSEQHELPVGEDRGFLWRVYSYWKFQERDGGVYVECEAISLTRSIPTGTGWIIKPIIRSLPRESLSNTLAATRAELVKK